MRVTTIESPRSPARPLLGSILGTLDVPIKATGRIARGRRVACRSGGGHSRSDFVRGRRIGIRGRRREVTIQLVGGRSAENHFVVWLNDNIARRGYIWLD